MASADEAVPGNADLLIGLRRPDILNQINETTFYSLNMYKCSNIFGFAWGMVHMVMIARLISFEFFDRKND